MYTINKQLIIEKYETIKKFVESRGSDKHDYFYKQTTKKVSFNFVQKWNLWIYVIEQDQLTDEVNERTEVLKLAKQRIKNNVYKGIE